MAILYQNVWAQGDYIYHTTDSGIDVYNSDASSRIGFIVLPAIEEERRQVVVFNEPTPYDDYPAPVTLSGSDLLYLYSTDGDDIHFQDMSNNELDFWIEHWSYNGVSDLWVKVPASGTTSVYIHFDHDANINYGGGVEAASAFFYDDFSVYYDSATGLGPDWTIGDENQFVVSDGKLRVGGTHYSYAWATINIDRGYNFGMFPIAVTSSIKNINQPGPVGGSREYVAWLNSSLPDPGWHYDRWAWFSGLSLPFNAKQEIVFSGYDIQNHSGDGMTLDDSIVTVYFEQDSIRAVADRATDPFDLTFSGTTRIPKLSWLTLFGAFALVYDVDYVKVARTDGTCSGTTSGTVGTVSYPVITEPTSVWANDDDVYIGTTTAGIYSAPVSTVSGASTVTGTAYKKEPNITSNNTVYLHGADDYLCVSTAAGVDRYNLTSASGIYTNKENIYKCHQTTSGTLYYMQNNNFFAADESPTGLGRPLREWTYYQHLYFIPTTIDNSQVRVIFQQDFPYQNTKAGGDDIRFIDSSGQNLSYYIESWHPAGEIIVKVATAGTDNFYMLYGNNFATAQSSQADAYYFYDDFSTLDSSVWTVYKGHGNNYAVITNNYLNMYDYNNSGTAVVTNSKLSYSLYIKARIRRNGGTSTSQMDAIFGYESSPTKNRPNRGYTEIDVVQGADDKLHYLHAYDTAIQGFQSLSTTWYVWEAVWAPGYQKSIYKGEILERTSTNVIFDTDNYFAFHIDNSSNNPNFQVDWITMETWPPIETRTGTEELFWELIHPKLHAVYTPESSWSVADYVYEEFFGDPLFLNDIYITEGTSSHGNNTIFLATDRAAHIIDEKQGDEANAALKRYYID